MMRSLNEVAGIVWKAALGAGIPVGQAEVLGRTVSYLAGINADLQCVTTALLEPPALIEMSWEADRVTILSGTAALSAPIVKDAFLMRVPEAVVVDASHAPLILATLAESGLAASIDGNIIRFEGRFERPKVHGPVEVSEHDWRIWADLAAKTYVPENETSRASGAGAGLTDND